jgi:hypothetical protein
MWLNELCRICDIRKRAIVKAIPDNDIHENLAFKITRAMHTHRNEPLNKDELTYIIKLMDLSPSIIKLYDERIGAKC